MQHKITCNSLSSVGVSNIGELLTWGSNKYFILGQKRTNSSATMPATLKVSENDIAVTDVSLGEFHAACLINDKFTNCISL
jgi:alpha-tubulin suppressor-like RCC1 family protein